MGRGVWEPRVIYRMLRNGDFYNIGHRRHGNGGLAKKKGKNWGYDIEVHARPPIVLNSPKKKKKKVSFQLLVVSSHRVRESSRAYKRHVNVVIRLAPILLFHLRDSFEDKILVEGFGDAFKNGLKKRNQG